MKICVTGVAGLLGSHLADRMLEFGNEVETKNTKTPIIWIDNINLYT
jgi:nucleoside-diphosphate-sugar epimerase